MSTTNKHTPQVAVSCAFKVSSGMAQWFAFSFETLLFQQHLPLELRHVPAAPVAYLFPLLPGALGNPSHSPSPILFPMYVGSFRYLVPTSSAVEVTVTNGFSCMLLSASMSLPHDSGACHQNKSPCPLNLNLAIGLPMAIGMLLGKMQAKSEGVMCMLRWYS